MSLAAPTRSRSLLGSVAALVLGALLATGLALPAQAAPADFSVRVANKAGVAQVGLTVVAVAIADGEPVDGVPRLTATAVAGKPGEYTIEGLDQRPYTLLLTPKSTAASAAFIQVLGGGSTFPEAELFTPSASLTSLDVTLAGNGSLTGVVTGAGKPLAGVYAIAYRFQEGEWQEFTHGLTNAKGVYSLTDVSPGSYKVGFEPNAGVNFLPRFSGGATTLAAAPTVYVGLGKAVTVSAVLPIGGAITGRTLFLDYDSNSYYFNLVQPVAFPVLTRSGSRPETVDIENPRFGRASGNTGIWTVNGLATGDYVVMLVPAWAFVPTGYSSNRDVANYVNGYLESAQIISVVAGKTKQVSPGTIEDWFSETELTAVTVYTGVPDALVELEVGGVWHYEAITNDSGVAVLDEDGGLQYGSYELTVTKPFYETYRSNLLVTWNNASTSVTMTPSPVVTFTSEPTLSAAPAAAGETFTVTAPVTGATSVRYSWLRDGIPIFGAASSSYTAGGGDVGHALSVRVSAARDNQPTKFAYAEVGTIALGAAAQNTTLPWIAAPQATRPGTVLSARTGSWTVDNLRFQYSWYRGATLVGSAPSYVVTPQDANSDLHLEVVATRPGRPDSAVASSTTVTVLPLAAPVAKVAPKVTAKSVGAVTTFTIAPGTWPAGTTFSYEWRVNDAVRGTGKALAVGAADTGTNVVVDVRASRPGSEESSRTLLVRKGAATVATELPFVDLTTTGTPVSVGDRLTVVNGSWTFPAFPGAEANSYQWRKSVSGKPAVAIKGATAISYTPTAADLNGVLSVAVTHSSARFASATTIAPAGTVALNTALSDATVEATISGSPFVGAKLTAQVGDWPVPVTAAYQWFRCIDEEDVACVAIPKATTSSYLPTAADASALLKVRVSGSRIGYTTKVTWAQLRLTTPTAVTTIVEPAIASGLTAGSAHVGEKITVKPGVYDVPGLVRSYEWQRLNASEEWETVAGSSAAASYTPVASDLWAESTGNLRVIERVAAGELSTTHELGFELGTGTNALVTAPKLTAAATLWTISGGAWRAPGSTVSWNWTSNGNAFGAGLTAPRAGQTGTSVVAQAIVTAPGFAPLTFRLIVQKGSKPVATPAPITGGNSVAAVLQAPGIAFAYPGETGGQPVLGYQWLLNGVAIKGATASTYTVRPTDLAKKITVIVTSRSPEYVDGSYTTPAVSIVAGTLTGASSLLLPGGPAAGKTLGVQLTGFPASVVHAYQWQTAPAGSSAFVPAVGGVASSYIPKLADVGRDLRLRVTTTRAGFTTRTTYTETVTIVSGGALDAVVAPIISGTAKVGGLLTVSPGTWNLPATLSYQWFRNGVAIPGVTGTTFTPLADSFADDLWVVVTAKSLGYATVSVRSNVVAPALGVAPTIVGVNAPKISGTATACGTLTASTGSWNVDALGFGFTWFVGGVEVGSGRSYAPGVADVGQKATVVVTASRTGYAAGTASSAASVAITDPASCSA